MEAQLARDYEQRLNSLLSAIEQKCSAFDRNEALRICEQKKELLGYRDRLKADIAVLTEIFERSRQLSKASCSIRTAIQILAEHGVVVFGKILKDRREGTEKQIDDNAITELFRYLDKVGVPDGGELYALTAGILIYTETIPAPNFNLPDDVKIFELSGAQMDKLKEGHIETVLKKARCRMGQWGEQTEGGSGDEIKKISVRLSPGIRAVSVPGSRASLAKMEGVGPKLPRGSILPNAGRKRRASRRRRKE